jgi:hypothetical protein
LSRVAGSESVQNRKAYKNASVFCNFPECFSHSFLLLLVDVFYFHTTAIHYSSSIFFQRIYFTCFL